MTTMTHVVMPRYFDEAIDASNYQSLAQRCPASEVPRVPLGHGEQYAAIHPDDRAEWDSAIAELAEYPVLDDYLHAQLAVKLLDEYITAELRLRLLPAEWANQILRVALDAGIRQADDSPYVAVENEITRLHKDGHYFRSLRDYG